MFQEIVEDEDQLRLDCPECSKEVTSISPAHKISKIIEKLMEIFDGYEVTK